MPFLNEGKGENDRRNYFMINLHESMWPDRGLNRPPLDLQGSAVAQWLSVGLRSERSGVRYLPPPCCVLEQDTLLPESTG